MSNIEKGVKSGAISGAIVGLSTTSLFLLWAYPIARSPNAEFGGRLSQAGFLEIVQWFLTAGVFGVATGVIAGLVFGVLFGFVYKKLPGGRAIVKSLFVTVIVGAIFFSGSLLLSGSVEATPLVLIPLFAYAIATGLIWERISKRSSTPI